LIKKKVTGTIFVKNKIMGAINFLKRIATLIN
jgi:hypothetical protein